MARPDFVLLDRPGSALPVPVVASVLERFRAEGFGVLVFARNGETGLDFDSHLDIRADGSWSANGTAGRDMPC